ncbi:coiled-coil domain-containing protein 54 [Echinops telfairi]|uniref:Coiled-coil domain-containing protein 54 n=1 Tax=Echinops telfairi TaxID=9371 RepID=A0ABM0IS08_ECHTE|nr:coiled-coil domain-containing protein 54 [Echinops telfairi]
MYKLQAKRIKSAAGQMWTSNVSKIRLSLKNVYHKCKTRHLYSTRYPSVTSFNCSQDDISTAEDVNLSVMLQDIKTAQIELLQQVTDIVSAATIIQEKGDFYQKRVEALETRVNVDKNKQCTIINSMFSIKEDIDSLKKKVMELENQSSCSSIHCLEVLEGEQCKKIIELLRKRSESETPKKLPLSADSRTSSTSGAAPSYPGPSGNLKEKVISPQIKTLKKSNHSKVPRSCPKLKSDVYVYPDFSTWIKLTFIHGGKWRFFLSAAKLEEFIQWLLSRPTVVAEEPRLVTQGYRILAGPIASLTTACLSVFNYVYCLFRASEAEVTRL